jgi:hypothetical protein
MEDDDLPLDGEAGAIDAPEVINAPVQDEAPRSLEDIAAKMGWTPREQWRGDPEKWKPADQFVEHTAEVNTRLVTKLKSVDERLEHISRTNAAVTERLLAEQRQKLLTERQDAFDVGDSERFNQADRELKELPTVVQPAPVAPEVESFIQKHASWWNKDQEATNWVVNRANQLIEQGITSPARHAAIVERELPTYFPEYATPSVQPKAKAVALTQPGNRSGAKRALSLNDLPKEAQQAAAYFKTKGVSTEDYLASYIQSQEA